MLVHHLSIEYLWKNVTTFFLPTHQTRGEIAKGRISCLKNGIESGDHRTRAKSVESTLYSREVASSEAQTSSGVTRVTEARWLTCIEMECTGLWQILVQRQKNQEYQEMVLYISESEKGCYLHLLFWV